MNDSRQQVAATEPSDLRLKASATCHTIINGAFERRKRGRTRQPASITTTTTNENGTQIISIKSKSRPRRKRNNFCQINPNFPSVRGRVICCLGAGALISATVLMSLIIFSLFSTPTLANQQQQPFQTRSSRASSSSFMNGQAQPQMIPTTTTTTTSANPASTTTNQQQENQSSSNNHNRIILNQAPDPLVASISEHTSTVTWMKSNARDSFGSRLGADSSSSRQQLVSGSSRDGTQSGSLVAQPTNGGFNLGFVNQATPSIQPQQASLAANSNANANVNSVNQFISSSRNMGGNLGQPTSDGNGARFSLAATPSNPLFLPLIGNDNQPTTSNNQLQTNQLLSFSNRQGQLGPAQPPDSRARPQQLTRAQQPLLQQQQRVSNLNQQQTNSNNNNNQPIRSSSSLMGQSSDLQNRFQRVRAPSSVAIDQSPNPNLLPMPPLPPPQFPVNPIQLTPLNQHQQQSNHRLASTLSAFDLSSLANLANQATGSSTGNQQFNSNQQSNSQAQFARRVPAQQQAQNQNQNQRGPTELPFIRQVFRPASEQEQAGGELRQQPASGRPTPPPLFVPAAANSNQQQQQMNRHQLSNNQVSNNRQIRPINNNAQNNNNNFFEQPNSQAGGFSPVSRPLAVESTSSREQVFFEPNSQITRLAPSPQRQPAPLIQVSTQNPNNNVAPFIRSQAAPSSTQSPSVSMQPTALEQQARRRAPARRPSQRPQLPQSQPANDVIRVSTNNNNQPTSHSPDLGVDALGGSSTESVSGSSTPITEWPLGVGSSSSPPAASGFSSSTTTTTTGEPPLAVSMASGRGSNSRPSAVAGAPPRSSANIFALTSVATSAPSSFSPALPINQGLAVSGGRRRIPIRPPLGGSNSNAQRYANQLTTTTQFPVVNNLQQTTTTPPATTTTTTTTTQASTSGSSSITSRPTTSEPATSNQSIRPDSPISGQPSHPQPPVRRPEIEEFYETIPQVGSGQPSAPSTTQIDAFGNAAGSNRGSSNSNGRGAGSSPSNSQPEPSSDFYGSRLPTTAENNQQAPAENKLEPLAKQHQPEREAQPPGVAPVLVPVTYMTTLTYLTTVLHGTHTLEMSHESVAKSTELATLNAQLMDQIEHRRPIIEPTATIQVSTRTKGKATTIVNLKSAVSAYNQELVEALGVAPLGVATSSIEGLASALLPTGSGIESQIRPTQTLNSQPNMQTPIIKSPSVIDLADLEGAKKTLVTELVYQYTFRPAGPPGVIEGATNNLVDPTTSLRSETLAAKSLEPGELANLIVNKQQTIDKNGLLRLELAEADAKAINLGTTVDKEGASVTEVNMNLASYIKFDDITNALVESKQTRLPNLNNPNKPLTNRNQKPGALNLETSFNLELAFNSALEKLGQPASGQETPALDLNSMAPKVASTGNGPDLLRSPVSGSVNPEANQRVSASNLNRSHLRNRVASSRIRGSNSNLASSQLAAAAAANGGRAAPAGAIVTSSVVLSASDVSQLNNLTAQAIAGRLQKPFRSRIVRPQAAASARQEPPIESSANVATSEPASGAALLLPQPAIRSSKPRFVVVTRTGQFGVRSSAIGSPSSGVVSSSEASSISGSPIQVTSQAETSSLVQPTQVLTNGPSTTRALLKPNRFRNRPSTSNPSTVAPAIAENSQQATAASTNSPQQRISQSSPTETSTTNETMETSSSSSPSSQSTPARPRENEGGQGSTSSELPTTTTTSPTNVANKQAADNQLPAVSLVADNQLDSSVLVTYFTTTTHTIAFTMSSDTIFTTIEETNTRIATEMMRDLTETPTLLMVDPTQVLSPIVPILATTAPELTSRTKNLEQASNEQQTTSAPIQSSAGDSPAMSSGDQSSRRTTAKIEPSFVVSLNTRTYYTTFTHLTTYSSASATPYIKSSESTTSNIVVETVTSLLPPQPQASIEPTAINQEASRQMQTTASIDQPPATDPSQAMQAASSSTSSTPITTTTNGPTTDGSASSQTSSGEHTVTSSANQSTTTRTTTTTKEESSTSSSTVASQPRLPEVESQSQMPNSQPVDQHPNPTAPLGDKITRTRSMYTTLTHYITFYSGTKTQLSTIQEISPTVMTEYIDRTDYDRQQALESARAKDSGVLIIPTEVVSSSPSIQVTPTPVLPSSSMPSSILTASSEDPPSSSTVNTTPVTTPVTTTSATEQAAASTEQQNHLQRQQHTSEQPASSTTTTEAPQTEPPTNIKESGPSEVRVTSNTNEQTIALDSKLGTGNNIIELSDLIASNSSHSGRVALAGNLGAAIKDIVQLLAGNKTNNPLGPPQVATNLLTTTTSTSTESTGPNEQPQTTITTTSSNAQTTTPTTTTTTTSSTTTPRRQGPRVFGPKAKTQHQHLDNLEGSITSPNDNSKFVILHAPTGSITSSTTVKPTPELEDVALPGPQSGPNTNTENKPTIFFGDDGPSSSPEERRKQQVKTVWPGAQSTLFVTSIEPSTRLLTLTSTRVYYTRDSPLTVTSSYTSTIAPRTFVSTIVGTRTLVNQAGGPTQIVQQPAEAILIPKTSASTQAGGVQPKTKSNSNGQDSMSRQDSLAANNRLAVQEKQRKHQVQLDANQKKLEQAKQPAPNKPTLAQKAPFKQQDGMQTTCQPACKEKLNEVCRLVSANESGPSSNVNYACVCRPGYQLILNQASGKRQCQEIQSYVVLLRLLQIGDQQVAYKRELQDQRSTEYKQMSRIIRDHVKRAYMTSDLTRDRFVNADVTNYARSLSVAGSSASSSLNLPSNGRHPISSSNMSLQDPLGSGLIVNITVQLQPPIGNQNEIINELTLKEELTKKLNLRQAAALAAAANAASAPSSSLSNSDLIATGGANGQQSDQPNLGSSDRSSESKSVTNTSSSESSSTQLVSSSDGNSTTIATGGPSITSNTTAPDELESLPNPNALFLADVELVSDLDECANPQLNDCHETASCINEVGSYRCDCADYPDLNPIHPGRSCGLEIKACDYCNNRGDCIRVPSLLSTTLNSFQNGSLSTTTIMSGNNNNPQQQQPKFSTVCQCNPFYLGRRCDINGWVLATVVPTTSILLIVSICLIIYLYQRWRKRSALSKGFRNIGTFGPNLITGTLDRKAMLESSSETSDTHQRSSHHHGHAHHHHHHHHPTHHGHHLSAHQHHSGLRGNPANTIYDVHGALVSDGPTSSSNESSPRQMVRNQASIESAVTSSNSVNANQQSIAAASAASTNNYCSSIPPQIVIPRARHNQVNYAVHRGQVYMW